MFFLLIVFVVLTALIAPRWGADTRDGRDWYDARHDQPYQA